MIHTELKDSILYVFPVGRIDSANASQVEKEIQDALVAVTFRELVIDAEKLDYVSSAGLRVILRLRKSNPTLKIINVSPDVYDILEVTGFTEIVPVTKAYRKVSIEGCEVIGQGANGKVYRLDEDTVIKVYRDPDCLPDIQRERELARKAFILGIPTAIPYDVVKVGESYGSVFELLNSRSFGKLIAAEPDKVDHYVALYVELLQKIHSTEPKPGDMPEMKSVAMKWASFLKDYLPAPEAERLCDLIRAVPDRGTMLHGDYHIKNVMMQNGEVLLIDMDTLCTGHPVFEFASMFLAYQGFGENDPSIIPKFLGVSYETATEIWKKTLRLYFKTDDEVLLSQYEDKARIIGYARLMRRTIRRNGMETEEGRQTIETCKKHIIELPPP